MQAVLIYKAFAKVYPLLFEEKYLNKYIYFFKSKKRKKNDPCHIGADQELDATHSSILGLLLWLSW